MKESANIQGGEPGQKLANFSFAAALVLMFSGLSLDFVGIDDKPGLGPGQLTLISSGGLLMLAAIGWDMLRGQRRTKDWLRERVLDMGNLARLVAICLPLALLIVAIRQFHLENEAFFDVVLTLAFVGFIIHYFLPDAFRLPFFLLLSLTGIIAVMGLENGAWLIGVGLALLFIANLPLRFALRVALLLAAGGVLALLRLDVLSAPWSSAIWPVLGSMFFIRMIIYVYDSKNPANKFSLWHSLSYFFLLPNVVFPLFPPVDYTNFRRGYYSEEQFAIYQRGLSWIAWGTFNLLVYRFINYHLVISPEQVNSAATLAQYMAITLLLYLRVIGQVYVILGICGLFGFRLPRPFDSMFLASSFTDFWRRANIYWKDFMQKVFFYPLFFALRGRGITFALVVGTLVNFSIAWFLHATQWFWLRGAFLTSVPDILFWTLLGFFVLYNVLRETKKRPLPFAKQAETTSGLLWLALRITGFFTGICVMWSMWTSPSLAEWFVLLSSVPMNGRSLLTLAGILLSLFGIFSAAVWFEYRAKPRLFSFIDPGGASTGNFSRAILVLASVAAVLFILGNPTVINHTSGTTQKLLLDMRVARLSKADAERLQRGYYEDLLGINNFNTELWEVYMKRPSDWLTIWQSEAASLTDDFRGYALLPSVSTLFHGAKFTTSSAALRDKEYETEKPPGTFRISLLGASRTMGSGVNDHETFEWLVEDRLNREMTGEPFTRYESLNFSVGGYTVLQHLAALDRVWEFSPEVIVYVPHPRKEMNKAVGHLARMKTTGVPIPFPKLDLIAQRAGVTEGMSEQKAIRLLRPYGKKIVAWAYGKFVAAARAHGAVPVWLYYPGLAPLSPGDLKKINMNHRVTKRLAASAGFEIIDLRDVYHGHDESQLTVAEWDYHPNKEGMRILADAIYQGFLDKWNILFKEN